MLRHVSSVLALALVLGGATSASAQSPPTKVARESAIDHLRDSEPSVASWRGSEVARRRYATTPGTQDRRLDRTDYELYDENERLRHRVASDSAGEMLHSHSYEYDEDGRIVRDVIRRRGELTPEEARYEYNARGRLIKVNTYRDDGIEPIRTVSVRYTPEGSVVQEQLMPDGSIRFVSEQTLEEFELAGSYGYDEADGAGAGYDVQTNVEQDRGAYEGENDPDPRPSTPQVYDTEEEVRQYPGG